MARRAAACLSDADDARRFRRVMVGADVLELWAERAWWGTKPWRLRIRPVIARRPKLPTGQLAGKPLPAAALVLPTERLPAMRFEPDVLQPGRVPQRPREEPQQEDVRSGVDAYLGEGISGHGGELCAPSPRPSIRLQGLGRAAYSTRPLIEGHEAPRVVRPADGRSVLLARHGGRAPRGRIPTAGVGRRAACSSPAAQRSR